MLQELLVQFFFIIKYLYLSPHQSFGIVSCSDGLSFKSAILRSATIGLMDGAIAAP